MSKDELKSKKLKTLDKVKEFIEQIDDMDEARMIVQHLIASYSLNKSHLKNR